ncbi:MAG: lamin tail domain-containing protein [Ekhidna sp.]
MKFFLVIAMSLCCFLAFGQYEITGTSEQTIDFNDFDGSGFASTAAVGQLDSDDWKITGMSDGDLDFGDAGTSGDYARGTSSGSVSTGGVYAFDIGTSDFILGVQPGGSDFSPGTMVLRIQNKTGATITSLEVSYEIYDFNDQSKSNSLNFSHGADDIAYVDEASLNFTTTEAEDSPAAWLKTDRTTTLSVSIAANDEYFLRWSSDEVGGSGSMDQLGIDDVKITATTSGGPTKIVGFESETSSETETNSNFNTTIPVTLENHDGTQVDLSVAVTGGSAESGDYTLNTSTLSFNASETQNISIDINSDVDVFDETIEITLAETSSEGFLVSPSVHTISISDDEAPSLVVNEIHADPDATLGDANGDGSVDTGDDEFFEIVNTGDASVEISDWVMADGTSDRHVFTNPTVLAPNEAIVVFGGGTPTGSFGGALTQTSSTGNLSLNNSGDDIILRGSEGTEVLNVTYGSSAGDNQSITLNPDLTGTFERHSTADTDDSSLFSPGTRIDGSSFVPITWDGSEDDDWTNGDNWDGGVTPTSADNVVIANAGTAPVISAGTEAGSNNLAIDPSASLTVSSGGSLAIFGTATNNGTYTVEKAVTGSAGYSILGSPVTSSTIGDLNSNYLAGFDNLDDSWTTPTGTDVMTAGVGFFVGYDAASPSVSFTGTPNSGDITYTVAETSGFELIANPYSSAITVADFLGDNSIITGGVYLWDDGGTNDGADRVGDYITVTGVGSASAVDPTGQTNTFVGNNAPADDGFIASVQGFFVEVDNFGTITFSPDHQTTDDGSNDESDHYRKVDYQKIKLAIEGNGLYNEVLIGLGEDATLGVDRSLDAKKFVTENPLSFYSMIGDDRYVIQGLPLADQEKVNITLGFDLAKAGSFEMSVVNMYNFPENVSIILVDHLLGVSYDLRETSSVEFTSEVVENDQRFELQFSTNDILAVEELTSELKAFGSTSEMTILSNVKGEQNISIYSLDGKMTFNENVFFKNKRAVISPNLTRNRVYILRAGNQSFKFAIK